MTVDKEGSQYVAVEYRRRTWKIAVDVGGTLLGAAYSIAKATSTAPSTVKLLQGGRACAPLRTPQQSLADSGRYCGSVDMLFRHDIDSCKILHPPSSFFASWQACSQPCVLLSSEQCCRPELSTEFAPLE